MILCPLPNKPVVTQGFGLNPQMYSKFGLKGHNGIDLRAAIGTPVYAPFEGVIWEVGDQGSEGYGKFIRLRKTNLEFIVAHLSRIDVKEGQHISLADPIALSGNTGYSTAPHLHTGLRFLFGTHILHVDNGFSGYIDHQQYIINWIL